MNGKPAESIEDRISALRGDVSEPPKDEVETVEDRINALRADRETSATEENGADAAPTYPSVDDHEEYAYPVSEMPAYPAEDDSEVSAYPADEDQEASAYPITNDSEVPAYPVDEDQEASAYPITNESEVPAYPVDEDQEGSAYPVTDNTEFPAYPVDDAEDVPYPTDVEYPIDDEYAYPNTDDAYGDNAAAGEEVIPYYIPEADTNHATGDEKDAPKKAVAVFKADKAVVGFVPTNLQVRRNVKTKPVRRKPTKPVSKVKEAAIESDEAPKPATKAVADDYDDFMTEINSLK